MEFIDLAAQQKNIREKIITRINKVLDHGQYIMGPEIFEFEKKIAAYIQAKHAITCSSGTEALIMALLALDIGPGDMVITQPFTFVAAVEAILMVGAIPVFVDIEETTFNIDLQKLQFLLTSKEFSDCKAIIPVDLFGHSAPYREIIQLAKEHHLHVIEDAAQALGGEYHSKKLGSYGDIGVTSFFPAKPLGCYGDGGCLFTDNDSLAEKLISLRYHGKGNDKYEHVQIGLNGRMDTIQAAVLLEKLEIFEHEVEKRQNIASSYQTLLKDNTSIILPAVLQDCKCAWSQYSILSENRERLQHHLKNKGIPTAVYYPQPIHLQPGYKFLGYDEGDFLVSESVAKRILSLPMHPYLDMQQIKSITSEMNEFKK